MRRRRRRRLRLRLIALATDFPRLPFRASSIYPRRARGGIFFRFFESYKGLTCCVNVCEFIYMCIYESLCLCVAGNGNLELFDSESGPDLTLSPQTFTSTAEAFINDNSDSLGVPGDNDTGEYIYIHTSYGYKKPSSLFIANRARVCMYMCISTSRLHSAWDCRGLLPCLVLKILFGNFLYRAWNQIIARYLPCKARIDS